MASISEERWRAKPVSPPLCKGHRATGAPERSRALFRSGVAWEARAGGRRVKAVPTIRTVTAGTGAAVIPRRSCRARSGNVPREAHV